MKFATIGTNFIVDQFLECAKSVKELEYISAYSRTEEQGELFAAKHNAKRYDTDLLVLAQAQDIDCVYIASPNSFHYEQAILMLQNKKHVLCEKIIASNEKELEEMLRVAKENGVLILEAMRPVFDPGFAAIEENLPKLGKIRRASFQYCQYSSRYDKFKNGIIENAFNPIFSNGALMDIGVYCIYPMVHLFGKPKNVLSDAIMLENGLDGAGTILFAYGDMQAEVTYSKIADGKSPSQIQGENATMLLDTITDTREIQILYRDGTKEDIFIEKPKYNMVYEVQAWSQFMEEGVEPVRFNQSSMMAMQVVDEVRKQQNIVFPADLK